ncbi:DUF732 domain-containing protein [Mycolicibacterium moriokaense]|nr:DUF732 domain-containing protein [Mycolicibacterium moriokaense]
MKIARRGIAKMIGTGLVVAAVGLMTPGVAAADTTEDAFLSKLFQQALLFNSRQKVLPKAHAVCDTLAAGGSTADAREAALWDTTLSPTQAATFMADSVAAFCPGSTGSLTSL